MIQILSASESGLQNIYTPLSFGAHFIFCAIATILYLAQFYRKGSWHYLLIMLAIDATFVTQMSFFHTQTALTVLAVVEVVLLAAAGVTYYTYAKAQKKELHAKQKEQDELDEKRRRAEKVQRDIGNNPVDNAFEDSGED